MYEDDPIGLPRRGGWFAQIKVGLEEVAFLSLVALSIIGELVGNYSPIISFWYWLAMIPVFAATAILTEWSRARAAGQSAMTVIGIQVAHWGGTVIALFATYSLWHVGRLGNEHTGLIVLLLLALTTFLDGYQLFGRGAALHLRHRPRDVVVAHARERDPRQLAGRVSGERGTVRGDGAWAIKISMSRRARGSPQNGSLRTSQCFWGSCGSGRFLS